MAIINKTIWGRDLTDAEKASIDAYIAGLPAGVTDGLSYSGTQSDNSIAFIRFWPTTELADAYVAFQNTLSPAPLSAVVL